jgi:hypothetical protein
MAGMCSPPVFLLLFFQSGAWFSLGIMFKPMMKEKKHALLKTRDGLL